MYTAATGAGSSSGAKTRVVDSVTSVGVAAPAKVNLYLRILA